MDYMLQNRDHFEDFLDEDFGEYIARKRRPDCLGDHLELQAMSEMFARSIEVYVRQRSEVLSNQFSHVPPCCSCSPVWVRFFALTLPTKPALSGAVWRCFLVYSDGTLFSR